MCCVEEKWQSKNKSGKLVGEEVANDETDIEIASIINRVALPTGYEAACKKCPSNLNKYAVLPV
jgi:hypothetical protein